MSTFPADRRVFALASVLFVLAVGSVTTPPTAHARSDAVESESDPVESPAGPVSFSATGGVGLIELVHLQLGYFVTDRIAVEARGGSVLFNPMVGLGVTGYLAGSTGEGRPPRHSLLISAEGRINPLLDPGRFESRGEVLAATGGLYGGYGFLSDGGFQLRILAGAVMYGDEGFAAGPNLTLGLGYAF